VKFGDPEWFEGTMCPKDYMSMGHSKNAKGVESSQCRKLDQVCSCVIIPDRFSGILPVSLPQMNAEQPGTVFSTDSIKNGVVVVEAYFNTCPYCNMNAPAVAALADSYKDNSRVVVLDVGIDRNDSDYSNWIAKHHPNHPVLKDSQRQLVKKLGTTSYPSTYVLNCHGDIVAKTVGQWSQTEQATIQEGIKTALQTVCE
jgi:peroxiredoxin